MIRIYRNSFIKTLEKHYRIM